MIHVGHERSVQCRNNVYNTLKRVIFFQQRRYLHTPNKSPQKALYCLNIYALIGYSFHISS